MKIRFKDPDWRKRWSFWIALIMYVGAIAFALFAFWGIWNLEDGWERTTAGIALFFSCIMYVAARQAHDAFASDDDWF